MSRLPHAPPAPVQKGKPVQPANLTPTPGPPTALHQAVPPAIKAGPLAPLTPGAYRTLERESRRLGLNTAYGEFMHGVGDFGYKPNNFSSAKRLYEHAQSDLHAEHAKVELYWKTLNDGEKFEVIHALENGRDLNDIALSKARLAVERIRSYRDWVDAITGGRLGDTMPRGQGPWTVTLSPAPAGYQTAKSFTRERLAVEYAELLEGTFPKSTVEIFGPLNTDDIKVPDSEPIPPMIVDDGPLPQHISPVDGITQAAERLLRYKLHQDIQQPIDDFRKTAQMYATVPGLLPKQQRQPITNEEFKLFDNQLRREVYGVSGMGKTRQRLETTINAPTRRAINRIGEAFGAEGDIVTNPTGGVGDALMGLQHMMQLTSISENVNRKAEFITQIVTETHDYDAAMRVEFMLLTPQGNRWATAMQDVMAASRPIVDPRVDDPSRTGARSAVAKVQNKLLVGHQFGTNQGVRSGVGNAHEYFVNHGKKPDLLLRYDRELLARAFPQLTEREAWNRVLAEIERLEQQAWDASQKSQAGPTYAELKRDLVVDYFTRDIADGGLELPPNAFVYPDNPNSFNKDDLHIETLSGSGMVPLGGELIAGGQLFLIRTMYLRWPGFNLNIETYAPNLTRFAMPYLNPRMRNAQHIYDMHTQAFYLKDTQVDPGIREALVQEGMLALAAQRHLPMLYWWTNRTLMAGGRLPLNTFNLAARATGQDEVDLQDLIDMGYTPDQAVALYHGGLASLGITFSGGDPGAIAGERTGDILGMRPDEQHESITFTLAEWLYNMTVGNAMPVTLIESFIRVRESQDKSESVAKQFGFAGSMMRFYRSGEPIRDTRGLHPLERSFRPPKQKYAGEEMPEPGDPAEGTLPLAQRFSDLTPAQRVFWLQLADEAMARVMKMESDIGERNRVAGLAQETEEALSEPGPVQASKLAWLVPTHKKVESLGYQPISSTAFRQRQQDIRNREPFPLDPIDDLGSMAGWVMNSRTKFERNVASAARRAAEEYMTGLEPDLGYGPIMDARKPGEIVVEMDRNTAIDQAIGFLTEREYGVLPRKYIARLGVLKENADTTAADYGPQHAIVQAYADLIMREYNKVINRATLSQP